MSEVEITLDSEATKRHRFLRLAEMEEDLHDEWGSLAVPSGKTLQQVQVELLRDIVMCLLEERARNV